MNALEMTNVTKTFPGFCLEGLGLTLPGGNLLLYILSAGSVVLYGLSWYASVVFYQKRENI